MASQPVEEGWHLFGITSGGKDLQRVAQLVVEDYHRYALPRMIWSTDPSWQIDLRCAEGRFELLVYAILLGAKVQRSVVDCTFTELRKSGLTRLGRLVEPDAIEAGLGILTQYYRALTPRARKAKSLVAAAQRVQFAYDGDIGRAYEHHGGQTDKLIAALREFEGIDLRAFWFCREMKLARAWPELDNSACLAVDNDLKVPLWFLGFVGGDCYFLRDVSASECIRAVEDYFDGDPLPLVAKARKGCHCGDSILCQGTCSVFSACQIRFQKPAGCF